MAPRFSLNTDLTLCVNAPSEDFAMVKKLTAPKAHIFDTECQFSPCENSTETKYAKLLTINKIF
jgi:hypothetical protein